MIEFRWRLFIIRWRDRYGVVLDMKESGLIIYSAFMQLMSYDIKMFMSTNLLLQILNIEFDAVNKWEF